MTALDLMYISMGFAIGSLMGVVALLIHLWRKDRELTRNHRSGQGIDE